MPSIRALHSRPLTLLLSLLVALTSTAVLAPAPAHAATGTASFTLTRTYTGTGHGTATRCQLNAATGYVPGDDTATDDVTCLSDDVGYDLGFNIQMYDQPLTMTLVLDTSASSLETSWGNPLWTAFCTGQNQLWSGTVLEYTAEDNRRYRACRMSFVTTTDPAGTNIAGKLPLTATAAKASDTVGTVQFALLQNPQQAIPGYVRGTLTPLSSAPGSRVIQTVAIDPALYIDTSSASLVYLNGKSYLGKTVSVSQNRVRLGPGSATKGFANPDPYDYRLDASTLPTGSLVRSRTNWSLPPTTYPDLTLPSGSSGNIGELLIPVEAFGAGPNLSGKFTTRLLPSQTSPKLGTTPNLNGQPEPGAASACTVDTATVSPPGTTGKSGYPNNDCALISYSWTSPAKIFSKSILGTETQNYVTSQGVTEYRNTAAAGTTAFTVNLSAAAVATADQNLYLCDEWDPADQRLAADPAVKAFSPAPSLMQLQYSSTGRCSDATSATEWYPTPAEVPGGTAAVRAVRWFSTAPVPRAESSYLAFNVSPLPNPSQAYAPFDDGGYSRPLVDTMTGRTDTATGTASATWYYRDGWLPISAYLSQTAQVQAGAPTPVTWSTGYNAATRPAATPVATITMDKCTQSVVAPAEDADWAYTVAPAVLGPSGQYCGTDLVSPFVVTARAKHTWTASTIPTAAPLTVTYSSLSPSGYTATNKISATYVEAPRSLATGQATSQIVPASIVNATKAVSTAQVEPGDPITWTMSWRNDTGAPTGKVDWIDVLPYDGDANGNVLSGRVVLQQVTPSAAGITLSYTKAAPASVSNDPRVASNQPGGATAWCTALSGGACPASLAEVTAVRFTVADMTAGQALNVKLTATTPTAHAGNTVNNRVGVGVVANLAKEVPSPAQTVTSVVAGSISGQLWRDTTRDGIKAADEKRWAGATVELLDATGTVVATTTTDAGGTYTFADRHSGTYRTRVVRGSVLGDAVQTYSHDGQLFATASLTSSPITLGRGLAVTGVDFGFAPTLPAIAVSKQVKDSAGAWVKQATWHWGSPVTWQVTVTNTGEVALPAVAVADALTADCARADLGPLAVGEATSYTCTSTDVRRSFTNEVTATSTVTPTWSPAAGDPATLTVRATDAASVVIVGQAGLSLDKQVTAVTRGGQGDLRARPGQIRAGDVIEYALAVTNAGDVPLDAVTLNDPRAQDLRCERSVSASAPLPVGGTLACTARHVVTDADFDAATYDNTATATGDAPDDIADPAPVEASASQPLLRSPSLALTKTHLVEGRADPGVNQIGEDVTWTFTVSNTGNRPVTGLTIADPSFSGSIACDTTTLAPGAETTCRATTDRRLTQADADAGLVDNTATAHGSSDGSPVASNEATDRVLVRQSVPALGIVKRVAQVVSPDGTVRAAPDEVMPGDRVRWAIRTTNTGDTDLEALVWGDPTVTDLDCGGTTALAVGESVSCTASNVVTEADILRGTLPNDVTVDGTPVNGANPPAQATAHAEQPLEPRTGLALTKDHTVLGGRTAPFHIGDQVRWTFRVTNTGNVTVTSLAITDPEHTGPISCDATTLKPGASTTCRADETDRLTQADADAGQRLNTATAQGTDPQGHDVVSARATDQVPVVAAAPGLSLDKQILRVSRAGSGQDLKALPAAIHAGDVIRYRFVVANSGDIGLHDVVLTDPGAAALTCPATTLAVGARMTCTGEHVVTVEDIVAGRYPNTATVTGQSDFDADDPAPATDSAEQPLQPVAALTLTKGHLVGGKADRGHNREGAAVRWTFTVSNAGNLPLTGLVIDDPQLAQDLPGTAVRCEADALAVGASTTCQAEADYLVTADDVARGSKPNAATARATSVRGEVRSAEARDVVLLEDVPLPPGGPTPRPTTPQGPGPTPSSPAPGGSPVPTDRPTPGPTPSAGPPPSSSDPGLADTGAPAVALQLALLGAVLLGCGALLRRRSRRA